MTKKIKYKPDWVTVKEFLVTPDHIKLLQRAVVSWMPVGIGAPCIDFLQPYMSTCVECDISKILNLKPKHDLESGKTEFSDEQKEYMTKLHKETQIVLQIFLKTGKMESGYYKHDGWYNWKKEW